MSFIRLAGMFLILVTTGGKLRYRMLKNVGARTRYKGCKLQKNLGFRGSSLCSIRLS